MAGSETVDHEAIQRARASLARCVTSPDFIQRFYELFMAASPEIAELFRDTDFERQKRVLKDSLFVMLVAAGTRKGPAHHELERLAKRHQQIGVTSEMYVAWVDTLLEAARQSDPEFSDELEQDWREAMHGPVALMQSHR